MSKKVIASVKGTRDFYPERMAVRSWLYAQMRAVSEAFGYQEYDGPALEPLALYAAKSGEELVQEQAFVFPDRSGELIALRPELTPTLARMVAQKQGQLRFPLRWWSFGPFWRYERPQRGRAREFFQWNIDMIGVNSPEADAELAAIGAAFFRRVGLTPEEVQILVNNRRLMDAQLERLGIPPEGRGQVFRLIDRKEKMKPPAWEAYARDLGLDGEQIQGLYRLLENEGLWETSEELVRFFRACEALGAREYIRFAPYIIRGLDYYTGTVFEARDTQGEFRAILGGGRYDNLVADVGGAPLPGVGFAMGDMVITLVLEKYGRLPDLSAHPAPVLVTVFDEAHLLVAYRLGAELREAGLNVTTYPEPAKLGKQFKFADRLGMKVALVLGPDELAQGVVTVKDLRTGEQVAVPRAEVAQRVQALLAG
ncbi:MAG TPA: histidine--tRNA ligase [Anaerolineae bacterium]|nr:histidine--tRNA ligase [Anaerolineae bacterium]